MLEQTEHLITLLKKVLSKTKLLKPDNKINNCNTSQTLQVNPNDELIEDKGVKVYIDSAAVMYLLGTEMDYKKEDFSSSFVFNNPNETERCGCGESFKIQSHFEHIRVAINAQIDNIYP